MSKKTASKSKKKSTRKKSRSKQASKFNKKLIFNLSASLLLFFIVALLLFTAYLDLIIRNKFVEKKWALPARVYAQPLELYVGQKITTAQIETELKAANYRLTSYNRANTAGSYAKQGKQRLKITRRAFNYWDGLDKQQTFTVELGNKAVKKIYANNKNISYMRVDPVQIAAIYPAHKEDRDLVKLDEVPINLIKALIITEDRLFYQHKGIRPMAILRALVSNIKAKRTVQGGSTITQQLVKNYFLNQERSLYRKFVEALMSLILEARFEKNEILEAYLNEVYLGQDKDRAIHGFGLAAKFYFDKALKDTSIAEQATLVAMVKGANYYNPRRHSLRTKKRRNFILKLMLAHNMINKAQYNAAITKNLGVVLEPQSRRNRYFHYIDLVKRQLARDYKSEDLSSEGLRIFTSLSIRAQLALEQSIDTHLKKLGDKQLQAAAILTNSQTGEILALVGSRLGHAVGFNRALDAKRQIGSIVKPAVYLTALKSINYHAATILLDQPLTYQDKNNKLWQPQNYDRQYRGKVNLYQALINSYNVPTARLGLNIGVENVSKTLRELGLSGRWENYPSLLLGAIESSPYQVTQMMQTLAAGGTYTHLRSTTAVITANGQRLARYPLQLDNKIDPATVYVLNSLLQQAAIAGTAKQIATALPHLNAAGKTGTTDNGRDAWFAGFSGAHLAVFWLGYDNNRPTKYTGSSGALPMWINLFKRLPTEPLIMQKPNNVQWYLLDQKSKLVPLKCKNGVQLPFIVRGNNPQLDSCQQQPKTKSFFKRLFNW